MFGLKPDDRVPRFRAKDAVNLPAIKAFASKTVLRSGDSRVRGLIAVTVLGAGLVVVPVLIRGLAVVNARIVISVIVSVAVVVVVAVAVVIRIAISVAVVRIVPPPRSPRIESDIKDHP